MPIRSTLDLGSPVYVHTPPGGVEPERVYAGSIKAGAFSPHDYPLEVWQGQQGRLYAIVTDVPDAPSLMNASEDIAAAVRRQFPDVLQIVEFWPDGCGGSRYLISSETGGSFPLDHEAFAREGIAYKEPHHIPTEFLEPKPVDDDTLARIRSKARVAAAPVREAELRAQEDAGRVYMQQWTEVLDQALSRLVEEPVELAWLPTPRTAGDADSSSGDSGFVAHFMAEGFLGDGPVYACVALWDAEPGDSYSVSDLDDQDDERDRHVPALFITSTTASDWPPAAQLPREGDVDLVSFALEPRAGHPLDRFVFTDLPSLGRALTRQQTTG